MRTIRQEPSKSGPFGWTPKAVVGRVRSAAKTHLHAEHMKLRTAIPDDALAISNVRVAAWKIAYQPFMPSEFLAALNPDQGLSNWRERLSKPSNDWKTTVAEVNGEIVGFVVVGYPRYDSAPNFAELWALNVSPAFWRRGIGRALTYHAADVAKSMGHNAIELWCIQGNLAAQYIYENCGFKISERFRSSSQLTGSTLHEVLYAKAL